MNDKQGKIEYTVGHEPSTYQTGSTKPPKSYLGVVLVLLGLVIFLGGIATALGFTNLRLFRALLAQQDTETNAVNFACAEGHPAVADAQPTGLGFSGETVPDFWHTYENLPLGIFIQAVDPDSDAARQGVRTGDILTHINGQPVTSLEALQSIMATQAPSEAVSVVLYREEDTISLYLRIVPTPND